MRLAPDVRFMVMGNLPPMDVYRKYVADTQEFRDWAERINDRGENLWIHLMKKNRWVKSFDMSRYTNTRHLYIAHIVARLFQKDSDWNAKADITNEMSTVPRDQAFRFGDDANVSVYLRKYDAYDEHDRTQNVWHFEIDIPDNSPLYKIVKSIILTGVCSYIRAESHSTVHIHPGKGFPLEVAFGNMVTEGDVPEATLSIIVDILYGFLSTGASYLTEISDDGVDPYAANGTRPGPFMRVFNQIGCSSCGNNTAQRQCGNLCGAVYCGDECAQSHYNKHAADCIRMQ